MFGIGSTELIIILVVALIVLGPKKLPQIARSLGKAMGEFKRVSSGVRDTIDLEVQKVERQERQAEARRELMPEDAAPAADVPPAGDVPAADASAKAADHVVSDASVADKAPEASGTADKADKGADKA